MSIWQVIYRVLAHTAETVGVHVCIEQNEIQQSGKSSKCRCSVITAVNVLFEAGDLHIHEETVKVSLIIQFCGGSACRLNQMAANTHSLIKTLILLKW